MNSPTPQVQGWICADKRNVIPSNCFSEALKLIKGKFFIPKIIKETDTWGGERAAEVETEDAPML
jgi:hypothetical protein